MGSLTCGHASAPGGQWPHTVVTHQHHAATARVCSLLVFCSALGCAGALKGIKCIMQYDCHCLLYTAASTHCSCLGDNVMEFEHGLQVLYGGCTTWRGSVLIAHWIPVGLGNYPLTFQPTNENAVMHRYTTSCKHTISKLVS